MVTFLPVTQTPGVRFPDEELLHLAGVRSLCLREPIPLDHASYHPFLPRDVNTYQLHLVSPRVVLSVFHLLTCLELYEGVQSQPDSLSSPGSHGWRVSQEPEPVVSNVKYNNTYGGIDTLVRGDGWGRMRDWVLSTVTSSC